jgi:hypothetical protein
LFTKADSGNSVVDRPFLAAITSADDAMFVSAENIIDTDGDSGGSLRESTLKSIDGILEHEVVTKSVGFHGVIIRASVPVSGSIGIFILGSDTGLDVVVPGPVIPATAAAIVALIPGALNEMLLRKIGSLASMINSHKTFNCGNGSKGPA